MAETTLVNPPLSLPPRLLQTDWISNQLIRLSLVTMGTFLDVMTGEEGKKRESTTRLTAKERNKGGGRKKKSEQRNVSRDREVPDTQSIVAKGYKDDVFTARTWGTAPEHVEKRTKERV